MDHWHDLCAILRQEASLLDEACSLATEKKTALIDSEADRVEAITGRELSLYGRIKEADQRLQQVMTQLAPTNGRATLAELVASPLCPNQQELLPLHGQLCEKLVTLRALQQQNQALITQGIAFVNFSVRAMLGPENGPAYTGSGQMGQGRNRRRVDIKA